MFPFQVPVQSPGCIAFTVVLRGTIFLHDGLWHKRYNGSYIGVNQRCTVHIVIIRYAFITKFAVVIALKGRHNSGLCIFG